MTIQPLNNQLLARKKLINKTIAFVITASASVCLFGLFWPFFVKGYESQTKISVGVIGEENVNQEFQTLLAGTLRVITQEPSLERLVQQVSDRMQLRNPLLMDADITNIRRMMSVKTVPVNDDLLQVKLVFRGLGSNDEKLFLQLFADNLAEMLSERSKRSELAGQINIDSVAANRYRKKLENLEQNLAGWNREVTEAKEWLIANVASPLRMENPSSVSNGGNSPFRSASHVKGSQTFPEVEIENVTSLLNRLERQDFSEIQAQLEDLKIGLSELGNSAFYGPVDSEPLTVFPVGGIPHPKQLILLVVMALACGSFAAIHYDPFAKQGFESLNHLAKVLRVPIVATIPINQLTQAEALSAGLEYRKVPWVNYLVHLASIFLAGFLAIVLGFCLLNLEIRYSFMENPFHGITHLVWFLMGR